MNFLSMPWIAFTFHAMSFLAMESDDVQPITKWEKLLMGSCKALVLQVQSNFVAHLKLMWHLVLIMALLVLVIELM
jgi:hypothetical protein